MDEILKQQFEKVIAEERQILLQKKKEKVVLTKEISDLRIYPGLQP